MAELCKTCEPLVDRLMAKPNPEGVTEDDVDFKLTLAIYLVVLQQGCSECKRAFLLERPKVYPYSCIMCSAPFEGMFDYQKHLEAHTEDNWLRDYELNLLEDVNYHKYKNL